MWMKGNSRNLKTNKRWKISLYLWHNWNEILLVRPARDFQQIYWLITRCQRPASPDNHRLALWPCVAWSRCLCPTPNQPGVNNMIFFSWQSLIIILVTNPAVTAAQDPAAAGADEAGSWQPEVLNIRECLHHAPRPQVQHLTILSLGTDGICNMSSRLSL